MAIKINLLAEAQELEDLRRRDPAKRFILGGAVLILVILTWSSSLLAKSMFVKRDLARLENEAKARESSYKEILEHQKTLVDVKRKIAALDRLATNRFLVGTLLNALQKDTLENVRLVRLKLDQTYTLIPEVKPEKGSREIPRPATIKESVAITVSAKDRSSPPGDGVTKFQKLLSTDPYFESLLDSGKFRLVNLGAIQVDPDGRSFLLMNLEGTLPEKIR